MADPQDHARGHQWRASDPALSAFVSANAGSGKTHVLVARVVRLMLAGTPPARILCLTFTRAAAAEMAERLFSTLAGWLSLSDEELTDTMSLDAYLIANKEATYILKVTGDSMMEAGILPGDLLLVERGITPRDGDIVIAQVDREWTMKFFRRRGRTVFLEAANKAYKPIHPQEELTIAAVVRAVIRKY